MRLGELEKQVLEYFWLTPVADAKQVYGYFKKIRGGTLNTIQSTLDRLYKKGLLNREKVGHAYEYRAALQRHEFIARLIKETAQPFAARNGDNLLAAFISVSADLDKRSLDKLETLIHHYRDKAEKDL